MLQTILDQRQVLFISLDDFEQFNQFLSLRPSHGEEVGDAVFVLFLCQDRKLSPTRRQRWGEVDRVVHVLYLLAQLLHLLQQRADLLHGMDFIALQGQVIGASQLNLLLDRQELFLEHVLSAEKDLKLLFRLRGATAQECQRRRYRSEAAHALVG